jgi:signal recognition particle subunit SRP54
LSKAPTIDEKVVDGCMSEIAMALLQSDVNVKYVAKLRESVKMQFKMNEDSSVNHQKLIQKTVVEGLTHLIESDRKPFAPKKGKSNIVMFVGL